MTDNGHTSNAAGQPRVTTNRVATVTSGATSAASVSPDEFVEFAAFEDLTRNLLRVSKSELDEKRQKA